MTLLRRTLAGLMGLALLTLVGAPAGAQTAAKPEPGCAGLAAKDAAADTGSGENTEILGLFFKTVGNKTTANIQIKNLTPEVPSGAIGVKWYVVWETADGNKFVSATVDSIEGGPSYGFGTLDGDQPGYSTEGETAGKFYEGQNGVIEITVPNELGAAKGKVLKAPYAVSSDSYAVLGTGFSLTDDSAPDEGGGKDYTVAECDAGTVPPPGDPGTQPNPANPGGGSNQTTTLPVTLVTKSAKNKKGKLALKVRSDKQITDFGVRLRKGTRTVGTAKVGNFTGTKAFKLKVKKKLKKGTYRLEASGSADGQAGTNAYKLRVK